MDVATENSKPIEPGQAPKVVLQLLTGTQEEGGRSAGIFTTDDLINLLLYVRSSMQLPSDLPTFIEELGTDSTGIAGLEPDEILSLYKMVTEHANRWAPIENLVNEQGANLSTTAETIVTTGGEIISVINEMDIVERLKSIGDSAASIPITTDKDKQLQEALPDVIAILRDTCSTQQKKTQTVLTAVRDYRTEISGGTLSSNQQVNGLEPAVADKKERAKKANLGGEIVQLQNDIDALGKQIEQLQKDYDKFVGLAFTGAAGGIIGLAITAGIFGSKAEKARKEKNKLIGQKAEKSEKLRTDQLIQGALNILATQFTDLGMRLLDAEQALTHLDFLWTDILSRIDQTVENWKSINDSTMLMTFVIKLKSIVNPWSEVGSMSDKLATVFDQAYEEFRITYGS